METEHYKRMLTVIIVTFHSAKIIQRVLNAIDKDTFDYAGGAGGYIDKYCFPFVRGRLFNTLEKDLKQHDSAKKIFWASGAAFIIRKELVADLIGIS